MLICFSSDSSIAINILQALQSLAASFSFSSGGLHILKMLFSKKNSFLLLLLGPSGGVSVSIT